MSTYPPPPPQLYVQIGEQDEAFAGPARLLKEFFAWDKVQIEFPDYQTRQNVGGGGQLELLVAPRSAKDQ